MVNSIKIVKVSLKILDFVLTYPAPSFGVLKMGPTERLCSLPSQKKCKRSVKEVPILGYRPTLIGNIFHLHQHGW